MVEIIIEDEVAEMFGVAREAVDELRDYCKK